MQAIRIHGYGDSSVLRCEEAPEPVLRQDDVLVRVHAAGINPADCQFRRGDYAAFAPLRFPAILGWDVAGWVERVGPESRGFSVGDAVFAMCDMSRDGAYAESVAINSSHVALAPRSMSLGHAAGVPLAALTAWHALFDLGELQRDQTVLVHAAAGGVGQFAVQLARHAGAQVIATASPGNHEFVRSLGADRCIDYHDARALESLRDVDVVIDGAGGETRERSWDALRPGGAMIAVAMPPADPAEAARRGLRAATAVVVPNGARLREIASLIDAGKLRVSIDSEFPLADVAAAHARSESRHAHGKILLRVGDAR
jgi:NADPH:quinone reductase-like Zn-dependent oxidoreductase